MCDDDNLDVCDEVFWVEDKCYIKGWFWDEFRMKLVFGVELVRMYKSFYGGKYGVWWLVDCVLMWVKCFQIEKQWLVSICLGLQVWMKSECGRFVMLVYIWLVLGFVFFDIEMIGFDVGVQVLEIGLVNVCGERIFEICLKFIVGIDLVVVVV